ncbi:histone-lysine N-methyltransferase SETD2-like [Actinia tenebrosa]|uniref:[histone H3]-lysine(36) N-trimethyltransferase n=1 Tax=Actinia tenebrosa TaxID=6105 RepID=A0A6P8H962_ACTTE|nr:histone-lysine N-methyltransferase SETD2-like [Actinia tenebrosa]
MTCECYTELEDNEDVVPCGENCLNRLLMIECNNRCSCGNRCTNKRFQQGCKVKIEVLKTEKKGWGLKTLEDLEENQFVMEYCGEVMNYRDFMKRAEQYDRQKRKHYYFMTLRADEIIDATFKGSLSRFVNHSCDPNCVTQKWTVNGLLRIGFFTLRKISAGEELTFDYQLQRYGKVAQTCYCESPNCTGIIGGEKHTPLKNAVERIVTPSTSSPRRKRKPGRSLVEDFDAFSIEEELQRLIGDHCGMSNSDQALNLSRLMVRAETMPQRIMLLKVLQNTTDQNCLKAFLRYQGLSLLWSWMVDAGAKPTGKLQYELLSTLKYLPVSNKNQLEDSKVIKVVKKWANKEMAEQEMPSSCSSQEENPEDIDRTLTQEDVDSSSSEKTKKKTGFEIQLSSPSSCGKGVSEEEISNMDLTGVQSDNKMGETKERADKSPDDLSEDDTKSTEDDQSVVSEDGDVGPMAFDLLKQWSSLKKNFRIPLIKKQTEVVVATSSTETPGILNNSDREASVVVSQPDSSGNIEEPQKPTENTSFTPPPLMSVEVPPIKSQGDPSNRGEDESSQDPSSSQEKCQTIPTISPEGSESRHQVFGYKQRMGNGVGDQRFGSPFGSQWPSTTKSKKHGKKSKWKNLQQFTPQQGSPQGIPVNINPDGVNWQGDQAAPNWQGPLQPWQQGPQDQAPSFYGPSEPLPFQQGQFNQPPPGNMTPCGIPPPNLPLPPNFPRNIPPPNYPPPSQPVPFTSPPYQRPPPNMAGMPSNIPPGGPLMSSFPSQQPMIQTAQQNVFIPSYPAPLQVPFQSFNTQVDQPVQFNAPQSNASPSKGSISQPAGGLGNVKDTHHMLQNQQGGKLNENLVNNGSRKTNSRDSSLSPSKPKKPNTNLPPNWKTATDPQGNVYYYHTVTRQTQWEVPREEPHDMDLDTPSDEEPLFKKKKPRTPKTPPGTPPRSPTLTFTTAAADTTQNRGSVLASPELMSLNPEGQKQKIKDTFRMKLSNVVVNCLNPYYKVDCKQGRITNADDFKYLARKLTHGLMTKELQHVKSEEFLQCNDSVKVKTKEYIRSYMKKFDEMYKRC